MNTRLVNQCAELFQALQVMADMAEEGRQSVSEISDTLGSNSRAVDSAFAVTRGHFLAISGKRGASDTANMIGRCKSKSDFMYRASKSGFTVLS